MVIAHRLCTIRRANRIAVLEDGRITAIGSHDELLIASPTYQRLYQLQFMDVPETQAAELAWTLDPSPQLDRLLQPATSAREIARMPIYSMTGFARVQVRVPSR